MNYDKILDAVVNKFHVILAFICQSAIIGYHFHTGKDLGSNVQNTVFSFYTFLGAHAFTYQKFPDKDGDKQ